MMSFRTPEIKPAHHRYLTHVSKYRVCRGEACINCGTCARLCPNGVHQRLNGYNRISPPRDFLCSGFECKEKPCVKNCPRGALSIDLNPHNQTLGDYRWTYDLILTTWEQAETGRLPISGLEYTVGNSGGGFDKMRFKFENEADVDKEDISTSIHLNRRDFGHKIEIPIPIYGGGMSFGSIGLQTMISRAKAARAWNTFFSTGEGGYPEEIVPYKDHVITQVATGLFGVREETIQRSKIIEFKYAQGAKPGLGGHLLGDKVTPKVAGMREAVPWTSLFSPFPFHSVYSIEDHKKHIDWIRAINPDAIVSVKVSTPKDVDMVSVGIYHAGANIINLDGGYGGTGAAPEIAKKNIAMPIECAVPKVHRFLTEEGIRDEVVLMASGGIRTAYDVAKVIALGADGAIIGTSEMVALGCVRCTNCESGRGCPSGIATTDPELSAQFGPEWGSQRLINLYSSWHMQLVEILQRLNMKSIEELRGRTDCLEFKD